MSTNTATHKLGRSYTSTCMHSGNTGTAALVSLHDCPCEWRQRHMASGESYLATLQTQLCCNVTSTWLITYHSPLLLHSSISLSFSLPRVGSSPIFSLLSFSFGSLASSSHALFCSFFFSFLCEFRYTVQETYSVGKPWGNMQRNECQDHIIQDAYRDIQHLNSAVCRIHAAIEYLWGLCLQQSICKYT